MPEPMTFPTYVMRTMWDPQTENPKHLLESVLANIWAAASPNCAHVWELIEDETSGEFIAAWIVQTEDEWDAWLRLRNPRLGEIIASTIKLLEEEANGEHRD